MRNYYLNKKLSNTDGYTLAELIFLIIILLIVYHFILNEHFIKKPDPGYIRITDLPGLTEYSKDILSGKDIVDVAKNIPVMPREGYEIVVRPINGKLFSEKVYEINPVKQDFNELIAEIKFVTDFNGSLKSSMVSSGVKGIWDGTISFIKGLFEFTWFIVKLSFKIIFHPIESFNEYVIGGCKAVVNLIKYPSIIIDKPVQATSNYFDSVERDIARKFNINPDKIYLQETLPALRYKRNIEIGGQTAATVAFLFIPGTIAVPAKVGTAMKVEGAVAKVELPVMKAGRISAKTETLALKTESAIAKKGTPAMKVENASVPVSKIKMTKAQEQKMTDLKKIMGGGPEDQLFDKNGKMAVVKRGEKVYDETCFKKGTAGMPGRKPTPDGMSIDHTKKTKTYIEDKRPSEWESNSWRSHPKDKMGVIKDPIQKERAAAIRDFQDGKITKAEADARIVIAEHDDHFLKRGTRWKDPDGVPSKGFKDNLGIRMPDSPPPPAPPSERVEAFIKHLKDTGRNPEVVRENGIVFIRYDIKK